MDTAAKLDTAAQVALVDKLCIELCRGLSDDFTKAVDWQAYPWARKLNLGMFALREALYKGEELPGQNGNNDGMGEWT